MTIETTHAIADRSDRYGNYLLELMDKCDALCLRDVPEEIALAFLEELKTREPA